jgi:hypothetical protein
VTLEAKGAANSAVRGSWNSQKRRGDRDRESGGRLHDRQQKTRDSEEWEEHCIGHANRPQPVVVRAIAMPTTMAEAMSSRVAPAAVAVNAAP